jgi:zinc protease
MPRQSRSVIPTARGPRGAVRSTLSPVLPLLPLALLFVGDASAEVLAFPSGLRVVLAPTPDAPRVATSMVIGAGTLDDPEGREGVAHLVEHLWFDSHEGIGPTAWDELHGLGCAIAADTWPEYTRFGTSCPPAAVDALLALELRRVLRPLAGVEDEALALAQRVVAAEEVERDTAGAELGTSLLQALYPADHPVRARLARPRLAPGSTRHDAVTFAEVQYRPEQAVLAVTGRFDATAVRAWLTMKLGPPAVDPPPRAPTRTAPPFRRALRLAPRALPTTLPYPAVSMAWSLPPGRVSFFERALLADLVGRALWHRYRHDGRVIDLGCADDAQALATPLVCFLGLSDDASADDLAADVRTAVDGFWEGASAAHLRDIFAAARSQTLVDVRATVGSFDTGGGLADTLALSVLLGGTAEALDTLAGTVRAATIGDMLEVAREHLSPERALVVAWRPTPRAPVGFLAGPALTPPPRNPLPPPFPAPDAVAIDERTLPNGLRVLAIQRTGTPLLHAAARIAWPQDARDGYAGAVAERGEGATPASLLKDVIPWSGRVPGGEIEGVVGDAADAPLVLDRLLGRLHKRTMAVDPYDPWVRRARIRAERDRDKATWWAYTLPRIALDPSGEARARAALVHLDAMGAVYLPQQSRTLGLQLARFRPDGTTIVLVGPQPPSAQLDAAARIFSTWTVTAAAPTPSELDPVAPIAVPPLLVVDAPGAPATGIAWRCPIGADEATARVLGELVQERIFASLRADTGWSYGPSAGVQLAGGWPTLWIGATVPTADVAAALVAIESTVATLASGSVPPDALARAREGWLWSNAPASAEPGAVLDLAFGPDGMRSAADLRAVPARIRAVTGASVATSLALCRAQTHVALAGPADVLRVTLAAQAPEVWTVAEARARVRVE